jgi:hypothetical protein
MVPNPEAIRNTPGDVRELLLASPGFDIFVELSGSDSLLFMRRITGNILLVVLFFAPCVQAQVADSTRIAVLSDSQDPTFAEPFVLKMHHNALAREMIYPDILNGGFRSVVHLGDMVSLGSSDDTWKSIDGFVDSLRSRGVAFNPIPGNHEYFVFPQSGIRNFESRFPAATTTGYLLRFASVAVVLVNSNLARLTAEELQHQAKWYREALHRLDADTSVKFVIVGTHHSPYTNSTIVSPSQEVDTAFVPGFLAARKTVLFLSGHAHAFEHYQRGGKDFLVIGGGGGLLQPLLIGARRRYADLYVQGGRIRMFHYLACTIGPAHIGVEVRMIREDFSGFDRAASFAFDAVPVAMAADEKKNTPSP